MDNSVTRETLLDACYRARCFRTREEALGVEVESYDPEGRPYFADAVPAWEARMEALLGLFADGFLSAGPSNSRGSNAVALRVTEAALDFFAVAQAAGTTPALAEYEADEAAAHEAEAKSERDAERACERYYEDRGEAHYESNYGGMY
jgi:hypothetical protein